MSQSYPQFFSAFFVFGLIVVVFYAWQQFNQPTFPSQPTLPRTVVPLRYLFLKSAYRRARFIYVFASILVYCALVWPGPIFLPVLGLVGVKDFPPEAWSLLIALFLVGLVPNSNVKWLSMIEGFLRQSVHAWFLVPDGVLNTIGVLEDTSYEPPSAQLEAVPGPLKERLKQDLKLPTSTQRYRWARASMLMASLQQMGSGAGHPLRRAAFAPFEDEFEDIRTSYKALESAIAGKDASEPVDEDKLTQSTDKLLRRIYAYISWGVRNQADSEQEVDELLTELGFRVPATGGRALFDVVAPAMLALAVVTVLFWIAVLVAKNMMITSEERLLFSEIVVIALISGATATTMYGFAVLVALKQRQKQIDRKVWREGSAACLAPIAILSGLITWVTITVSTLVGGHSQIWNSLIGLGQLLKSLAGAQEDAISPEWIDLPKTIIAALPWFLAGAMVSVRLANTIGRNILAEQKAQRVRDMITLAIYLGAAVTLAHLFQRALAEYLIGEPIYWPLIPMVGLAGMASGAIIGFIVPRACRDYIARPRDRTMARALQNLSAQAERTLGRKAAAEDWVFSARDELGGITPAEAIQYKGLATSVWRLLGSTLAPPQDDAGRSGGDRAVPVLIKGGLASGN